MYQVVRYLASCCWLRASFPSLLRRNDANQLVLHEIVALSFNCLSLQQDMSMGLSSGDHECGWQQHDLGPSSLFQWREIFWKSYVVRGSQAHDAKARMTNQQQIARLLLLYENLCTAPSSVHTSQKQQVLKKEIEHLTKKFKTHRCVLDLTDVRRLTIRVEVPS